LKLLNLAPASPEENLAMDEALVEAAEAGETGEVLRFWEAASHFVVLGAGGATAAETNLDLCRADSIPVLRRCSGGGTVLQGPGCLNFVLVLDLELRPDCASIEGTNRHVLARICEALDPVAPGIRFQGTSDLAVEGRKVSGTAQRRKKRFVLFHGTLLHGFDLRLVSRYLREPSRQPDYRARRRHGDFVRNLDVAPEALKAALVTTWQPDGESGADVTDRVRSLVAEKYSRDEWNLRF
jgi:lipoate-protein ligase A